MSESRLGTLEEPEAKPKLQPLSWAKCTTFALPAAAALANAGEAASLQPRLKDGGGGGLMSALLAGLLALTFATPAGGRA